MTTRTTDEVEAGAEALHDLEWSKVDQGIVRIPYADKGEGTKRKYRRQAEACLDAADAAAAPDVDPDTTIIFDAPVVGVTAAAPAVGVTVEWLDARIAETQKSISEIQQNRAGAIELFGASERIRALKEVRALLTAQPEPGTHDDAGQPARRDDGHE